MSKSGTFDLASGVGGKIEKKEVLSAVDKYIFSLINILHVCYEFYLMTMINLFCISLSLLFIRLVSDLLFWFFQTE